MADTVRTRNQLLSLFPDNNLGYISAQDLRDFLVSTELATEAATKYAALVHTHTTSQITGLDTALAAKASSSDLTTHSNDQNAHGLAAVRTTLSGKANTIHTHVIADITGLQTTLNNLASDTDLTESDITTLKTRVTNVENGKATIASVTSVQSALQSHLNDTINPHGTTAIQVGAYTIGQVNSLLNNYVLTTALTSTLNSYVTTSAQTSALALKVNKSGDTFTGGISGTTAFFTGTVTGSALIGNGASLTGITPAQVGAAPTVHSHAISDITNLQTTLNSKAALVHSHAISDVTNLQTTLNAKADKSGTTFTGPVSGTSISLGTNLNFSVGSRITWPDNGPGYDFYILTQDTSFIFGSNTDINGIVKICPEDSSITATTFIGDGSNLTGIIASHLQGIVPVASLGTGTANSTTYLRGDGTWATVSGAGATNLDALTDVTITSPVNKNVLQYNGTNWVNSANISLTSLGSISWVDNGSGFTPSISLQGPLFKFGDLNTTPTVTIDIEEANITSSTVTCDEVHTGRVQAGTIILAAQPLTISGGAVAIDINTHQVFTLLLNQDVVLSNPSNGADMIIIRIRITQDGTGGHAVTLGTAWHFGSDITELDLDTSPNSVSYITAIGRNSLWDIVSIVGGY